MAVNGTVTENPDKTIRFEARCIWCGCPVAVDRLDPEQFKAWQAGALAQDAFPALSAAEREALVSGSHAECFGEMFPEDDEDEFPDE